MNGFVQIAGVLDLFEAHMLANAGVHRIGFPLRLNHHKEDISEEDAIKIIHSLKPTTAAVLITYLSHAKNISEFCRGMGINIVQLHGEIDLLELTKLKKISPDIAVIKSLIVKNGNFEELKSLISTYSPYVDAFITDTYDPLTGASGATGKIHDWNISREIVKFSTKPVILAGGLNPKNVREAILFVRPDGVDSHTGVECENGRKDKNLVVEFVREATLAFAALGR